MGKIRIKGSKKFERYIHKVIFRSTRNRVLQKLLLIYFNLWYWNTTLKRRIRKRLAEKGLNTGAKINLVYEITPKEVQEIIHVSERTAKEYIDALRVVMD